MKDLKNQPIKDAYHGLLHIHKDIGSQREIDGIYDGDGKLISAIRYPFIGETAYDKILNNFDKDATGSREEPFGIQTWNFIDNQYPGISVLSLNSPVDSEYTRSKIIQGNLGEIEHIKNETNGYTTNVCPYTQTMITSSISSSTNELVNQTFNIELLKNTDITSGTILKAQFCVDSEISESYFKYAQGLFKSKDDTSKSSGLYYRFNLNENEAFHHGGDNSANLGSASRRWATVYAGTGSIDTSDERVKTFIDIEQAEIDCAKSLKSMMRKFKFNSSIEEKGLDDARIHYGVGAQSVIEKMKEHGLDPFKYAFVCFDKWESTPAEKDEQGNVIVDEIEAGDRYGIRYSELLCFIISAM